MVGALGGAAGGQPVVEAVPLGLHLAADLAALQLGLLQRGLRVLLGLARRFDFGAQLVGCGFVQKVVHPQRGLDFGQIAHDGAAQADEKAGKHQRHQPQAPAEPFFGQTQ
ncbi:hypothetical protein D3C71_1658120 [compost metagenome]